MNSNFYEGHKAQLTFDPKTRRIIDTSKKTYISGKEVKK